MDAAIRAAIIKMCVSCDEMKERGGKSGERCRRGGGRARGKHGEDGQNMHSNNGCNASHKF